MKFRWDAALDRLPEDKKVHVAEIGVWSGKMSEKLLEGHPCLRLTQIDRWQEYTSFERIEEEYTRFSKKKQEAFNRAKHENFDRIRKYKKRVKLIEKCSIIAAKEIKNESLDMVFIDALHSFRGCRIDIMLYMDKVKKGGWIGGHDYHRIGVKRAVNLIFGDKVETDVDRTWWVGII
jgi:predicted O-methyltransferase YrrM